MKISVCIATYNGELFIKEQMNSILSQIGEDSEVIISDDISTDKTLDIIKNYQDSRIKIFINEEKKGHIYNFENALKKCSGEYIFLSDQDDVWLPQKVETILNNIKENQLIITDAWFCDKNLNPTKKLSEWRKYKRGYITNLYKSAYLGCTMVFTKNMKNYFLPFPPKLPAHDVWIGLCSELRFNVLYIDQPLIYYRRHGYTVSRVGEKSPNSFLTMIFNRLYFLYYTLKKYTSQRHD